MRALFPWAWITTAIVFALSGTALSEDGLLRKASPHNFDQTVERFEAAVRAKGLRVFPRVDHAKAAGEYGLEMPPSVVIGFGNPKYGTPFMISNPEAGIDFPPRAVVYEDRNGKVWIAYNSASYLYQHQFSRHGLSYPAGDVDFFRGALEQLTDRAVGTDPIGD